MCIIVQVSVLRESDGMSYINEKLLDILVDKNLIEIDLFGRVQGKVPLLLFFLNFLFFVGGRFSFLRGASFQSVLYALLIPSSQMLSLKYYCLLSLRSSLMALLHSFCDTSYSNMVLMLQPHVNNGVASPLSKSK